MSDEKHPLADKVDALVAKQRVGAVQEGTRNIPVLTDLVSAPAWSEGMDLTVPVPTDALVPAVLDDQLVNTLTQTIFARVAQRIDTDLAPKLQTRLNEQLQLQIEVAIQVAIHHVLVDMKQNIANEIGDAIYTALADKSQH